MKRKAKFGVISTGNCASCHQFVLPSLWHRHFTYTYFINEEAIFCKIFSTFFEI